MYEELIGELHIVASGVQSKRRRELLEKAADAIEQLDKDLERAKEWASFWQKEANEALKKFQVAVASKPRWIPVTERLPEEDCHVLAYYGFNHGDGYLGMMFMQVLDYFARDPRPHFQHEGLNGLQVTHWMPLPEPPKEETE